MLSSGNGENGHAEVRVYWDAATGECRRTRRRRPCDYVRRVAGTTDYDGVHSRATRARRHGDLRHGSGQFRGERSFSAARPARLRIRRGLRSMTRSPAAWVSRDDMPYACAGLCGSVLHSGRSILLIDLI